MATNKSTRTILVTLTEILRNISKDCPALSEIVSDRKTLESYVLPVMERLGKLKEDKKRMKLIAKECGGIGVPTAFMKFQAKHRAKVTQTLTKGGKLKTSVIEVAVALGEKWKALSEKEKKEFAPTEKELTEHKNRKEKFLKKCADAGLSPNQRTRADQDRLKMPQLHNIVIHTLLSDFERRQKFTETLSEEDVRIFEPLVTYKLLQPFMTAYKAGHEKEYTEFFADETDRFHTEKEVYEKDKEANPEKYPTRKRTENGVKRVKKVPGEKIPVPSEKLPDVVTVKYPDSPRADPSDEEDEIEPVSDVEEDPISDVEDEPRASEKPDPKKRSKGPKRKSGKVGRKN